MPKIRMDLSRPLVRRNNSPSRFRRLHRKHIAIGMPIEQAKTMQAHKFKCSYDEDDFGHAYLDCWISLKSTWCANADQEIMVLYDAGKVTALKGRTRIIAL
jgi:hypothetical protein